MAAVAHVVSTDDMTSTSTLSVTPLTDGEADRIEALALALATAVDVKGNYRPSHSHGVARAAQLIAHGLGFRADALFRIRIAGLVHDVGKLQVPDTILLAPRKLTTDEMDVIQRHPIEGHKTLKALGLHDEARWVLHHHERGDGAGYPTGLAGESIPLGSRILLVADAFDVMCSARPYMTTRSPTQALAELRANETGQFDHHVVDTLARALDAGVQLVRPGRPGRFQLT